MVAAVGSTISGLNGLGALATGGRGARATPVDPTVEATTSQDGLGFDTGTQRNASSSTTLTGLVQGIFAAQVFAQESPVTSSVLPGATPPSRAAAAYQTTALQSDSGKSSNVQMPGLPPRLSSGRMLDLNA